LGEPVPIVLMRLGNTVDFSVGVSWRALAGRARARLAHSPPALTEARSRPRLICDRWSQRAILRDPPSLPAERMTPIDLDDLRGMPDLPPATGTNGDPDRWLYHLILWPHIRKPTL